jgi:cardiolipin synthase
MSNVWSDLILAHAEIITPIRVTLAALVTIHVLLHKREVASAVGWIGLSWFSPIAGAAAYAVLGVNRVQRRARRLRQGDALASPRLPRLPPGADDHLDPLARGVGRITGCPLLVAEAIETYQNGDEAYPPMLAAIDGARVSIGLSSYIFRNDAWGARFIDALARAHARGVAVRVLIDGVGGNWITSGAYRGLRRRGVPAARFLRSPFPWRMPFLNLRSHKKILVIDGAIAFTGGINIAAENVLAELPAHPVQDTHFRIQGSVVRQLVEAFVQDWSFTVEEDLGGHAWFPPLPEQGPANARVIDSGPDEDLEKIEYAILQAVACARTRVTVMTPYFLPDERLVSALSLAAIRGVAVDIIVPEISDHRIVTWAMRANSPPLLRNGVRIWLSRPPFRHSKVALVDDEWVLIGSANWDIRSFRLNFELCMELYDRPLATTLTTMLRGCMTRPLTLAALNARPMPQRLRDAAARLALPYL